MKAQFVKTFIKAAAIVALAASIANCGAMPEESITETTYQPSSQPADPSVDAEGDDDAELIIDNCESWGMTYDVVNGTCVDSETDTNIVTPPVEDPHVDEPGDLGGDNVINPPVELDEVEALNFTVTPGERRVDVSFSKIEGAISYRIERVREGSSRVDVVEVYGTTYGFLTLYCSAYSYKLVAEMADGTTVETPATDYVVPTNCE